MYCTNCQAQIQDTDKFCRECGEPQPGAQGTGNEAANWELCEVRFKLTSSGGLLSGLRGCFRAVASGKNGSFVAAKSREVRATVLDSGDVWPDVTEKEVDTIVAGFTTTLGKERWEPLGQAGPYSWQHRYRRRVP